MAAQTLPFVMFETSDSETILAFRVITGPYPKQEAVRNIQRTLTGNADIQYGPIVKRWALTVKVRETEDKITEDEVNYGSLAQLQTLFALNDPGASATPILTFYSNLDSDGDGTGDTYDVVFTGSLNPENITFTLSGSEGWAYVALTFEAVEAG